MLEVRLFGSVSITGGLYPRREMEERSWVTCKLTTIFLEEVAVKVCVIMFFPLYFEVS